VDNPSAPPGKSEKYAQPERERRWLLSAQPDLTSSVAEAAITDLYLTGTRLRLRRSEDSRGISPTIYKLTQKVPGPSGRPGLITNVYLTAEEYQLLSAVGGDVLSKRRYSLPPFGIDMFDPPLDGLVLAEAEFSTDDEAASFPSPPWAVAEVTNDARFTGGHLVCADRDEVAAGLAGFGVEIPIR
jgi:CYTH domain-containing protein